MYRVLLLSHGSLAHELLRTVVMVIGKQPEQEVMALALQPEEDMDEYYRAIDRFVTESGGLGGCMIFTDIAGGSPFITSAKVYRERAGAVKMDIITGMNLPMVIEAISNRGFNDLDAARSGAVRDGIGGIHAFSSRIKEYGPGSQDEMGGRAERNGEL